MVLPAASRPRKRMEYSMGGEAVVRHQICPYYVLWMEHKPFGEYRVPSFDVAQKYMDLARWYIWLAYGWRMADLREGSCAAMVGRSESIQLSPKMHTDTVWFV